MKELLDFIRSEGSPTYREIGRRFGWSSKGTISRHIDKLVETGVVSRQPGYSRVISIQGSKQAVISGQLGDDTIGHLYASGLTKRTRQ